MNVNATEKAVDSMPTGPEVGALDTLGWELTLGAGLGLADTDGPGVTVGVRLGSDEGPVVGATVREEGT